MELQCPECNHKYEVDAKEMEETTCPDCGFGPDRCNHPVSYRESEWIYSVDEGQNVERVYCGKCGMPVNQM